jgi:hypothetical protein
MYASSIRRRAFLLYVCLPLALLALNSGQGCFNTNVVDVRDPPVIVEEPPGTVVVVEPDAFGIDLINDTVFDVDPGVSIDDFVLDLGVLAPLEGSDVPVPFDVDCFPGDTLTIDPTLLQPGGVDVLVANPLVIEEGIDYFCGDIITIDFFQDNTGTFFIDVFVNDQLINP